MQNPFSKVLLLTTIIVMDFLTGMEFDLFVPSFPEIQKIFNLTPFWVEALLSINFIGYCASLFITGALADRYGRKPVLLSGLLIFIAGSMLCLWGGGYELMLLGRLLQGVGVASPCILSFLIIADLYPLEKQQSLFALLNGICNISVGIAPVLGSYISLYYHWQGNFIALLILGIFSFIMSVLFIPATKPTPSPIKSSPVGYRDIFKSKPLLLLIIHIIGIAVPYWVFVGMAPLLYMEDLGVSLSHFGYYQGSLAFLFAIGTLLSSPFINRFSHKKMLSLSNSILILSFVLVMGLVVLNSTSPLMITFCLLIMIVGQILPVTLLYPLSLNLMPEAKGRISGVLQGFKLILCAISLQFMGYFYNGSFRNIGLMLSVFIFLSIVTLGWIIKNKKLMGTQTN
ncbi:MAG: MFS transporter [Proteobacteria bacterium]|nr:MFS transporter [Pseudomonadota bacterium]